MSEYNPIDSRPWKVDSFHFIGSITVYSICIGMLYIEKYTDPKGTAG